MASNGYPCVGGPSRTSSSRRPSPGPARSTGRTVPACAAHRRSAAKAHAWAPPQLLHTHTHTHTPPGGISCQSNCGRREGGIDTVGSVGALHLVGKGLEHVHDGQQVRQRLAASRLGLDQPVRITARTHTCFSLKNSHVRVIEARGGGRRTRPCPPAGAAQRPFGCGWACRGSSSLYVRE
jgi:hypothetical protein